MQNKFLLSIILSYVFQLGALQGASLEGPLVRSPAIFDGKPIRYYINRRNQIVDEHVAQFKKYVDAEIFGSGGGCPEKIREARPALKPFSKRRYL
ncbi:MAG: hypothetical protein K0S07_41 [Chlamydiales bacterium]|jgi:hypothetical protein|nr:hypothetical protein [Chlamydiales bacterium]